jgi:hypothetical protein
MDVREKLVEILKQAPFEGKVLDEWWWEEKIVRIVDHLIANGITVQDNTEISDEILEQLRNAPVTVMKEESTIEVVPKWISVKERLPSKEEYTAKAKDGTEYYVRLLIAYKTDIVEYEIGYYDGYKWMTEMPIKLIKDVVAWIPFPNMPQPPKGE